MSRSKRSKPRPKRRAIVINSCRFSRSCAYFFCFPFLILKNLQLRQIGI